MPPGGRGPAGWVDSPGSGPRSAPARGYQARWDPWSARRSGRATRCSGRPPSPWPLHHGRGLALTARAGHHPRRRVATSAVVIHLPLAPGVLLVRPNDRLQEGRDATPRGHGRPPSRSCPGAANRGWIATLSLQTYATLRCHDALAAAAMTEHTISIDLDRRHRRRSTGTSSAASSSTSAAASTAASTSRAHRGRDPTGCGTDVLEAHRAACGTPTSAIRAATSCPAIAGAMASGPCEDRPVRSDPAWNAVDPNTFGTNEFIGFCRQLGAEPYLVVNCGDGDMREARDWVEYCNGTTPTALVKLREAHGFPEPHRVRYWGIGNEVDGPWQVGFKTPAEYARTYHEFAKVMRWVDPAIKLIASAVSLLGRGPGRADPAAAGAGAGPHRLPVDPLVRGRPRRRPARPTWPTSELIEDRLTAIEGLSRALTLKRRPRPPIPIAVDEWNVWYRATPDARTRVQRPRGDLRPGGCAGRRHAPQRVHPPCAHRCGWPTSPSS